MSKKDFPIYRLTTRVDLAAVARLEQLAEDSQEQTE